MREVTWRGDRRPVVNHLVRPDSPDTSDKSTRGVRLLPTARPSKTGATIVTKDSFERNRGLVAMLIKLQSNSRNRDQMIGHDLVILGFGTAHQRKTVFVKQLPFFNVRSEWGCCKSPARVNGALNRCGLLRRVIG
jgi:hypothetical protein